MIPTIIKNATLYNCDCMELMKQYPDNHFDLAIVDPPYGIGAGSKSFANSGNKWNKEIYRETDWDSQPPSKEYFDELFRVSKNQIIWGGNYFFDYLKSTRGFIVWDKEVPEDFSYAMCEFAWTSFDKNAKIFIDNNKKELKDRIHPTQKPVRLYQWILKNYAKQGDKILDTYLGSGSIAIACNDMEFNLVGCELDKKYFESACKRISHNSQQERLF